MDGLCTFWNIKTKKSRQMAQNIIKQFFVKIDDTALLCDILYMDLFFIGFFFLIHIAPNYIMQISSLLLIRLTI